MEAIVIMAIKKPQYPKRIEFTMVIVETLAETAPVV
jgi:hypothetical protein